MSHAPYNWQDKNTCDSYDKTWEISLNEVHYGWLAPGEKTLGLLEDLPKGAKVLDVGCGMGENMTAMHKLQLDPYGIDISDSMLKKARRNLRQENVTTKQSDLQMRLKLCDMKSLQSQFKDKFHAIISAYSLEFLPNIQDFQQVVQSISDNMHRQGTFVFCVAHPTTHPDYPLIKNESVSMSNIVPTLMYSIKETIESLCNANFVIERIIEQQTFNPSQMKYEQACQFPYHFRKGRNPFHTLFDTFNNKNPHTLIYKARKML
jgi:ubiquinone/menaquinone biosynthesis C-methylase UbiE